MKCPGFVLIETLYAECYQHRVKEYLSAYQPSHSFTPLKVEFVKDKLLPFNCVQQLWA